LVSLLQRWRPSAPGEVSVPAGDVVEPAPVVTRSGQGESESDDSGNSSGFVWSREAMRELFPKSLPDEVIDRFLQSDLPDELKPIPVSGGDPDLDRFVNYELYHYTYWSWENDPGIAFYYDRDCVRDVIYKTHQGVSSALQLGCVLASVVASPALEADCFNTAYFFSGIPREKMSKSYTSKRGDSEKYFYYEPRADFICERKRSTPAPRDWYQQGGR
jgi:hypothetical protein